MMPELPDFAHPSPEPEPEPEPAMAPDTSYAHDFVAMVVDAALRAPTGFVVRGSILPSAYDLNYVDQYRVQLKPDVR